MKWALKLGNFDIKFVPRTTIKGKLLVGFTIELIPSEENERITLEKVLKTDRASNHEGAGVGSILKSLEGFVPKKTIQLDKLMSNN